MQDSNQLPQQNQLSHNQTQEANLQSQSLQSQQLGVPQAQQTMPQPRPRIVYRTVLPVKKKTGLGMRSCFFCLGLFFLVILIAVVTYSIIVLMNREGITFRGYGYDYEYNYRALSKGPWLSDNELLADFEYRRGVLEEAGIPMNDEYYRTIINMDYETYLQQYAGSSADSINNPEYKYSFSLQKALKYKEHKETYQVAGGNYTSVIYCYLLEQENDFEDIICGTGMANVFSIVVMTDAQYLEYKESPIASPDLLGSKNGNTYILEHPNGEIPPEVGDTGKMMQTIKSTFVIQ